MSFIHADHIKPLSPTDTNHGNYTMVSLPILEKQKNKFNAMRNGPPRALRVHTSPKRRLLPQNAIEVK